MNKVYLSGNLTKDPELKSTQSGKSYVRVAIAVKRPFSKDKDAVDFINLMAWEHNAKFLAKWFSKGSRVLIEGCLQTRSYEKDGIKHNVVEVLIDQIEFAGGKKDNSPKANNDLDSEPIDDNDFPDTEPVDTDDLPF